MSTPASALPGPMAQKLAAARAAEAATAPPAANADAGGATGTVVPAVVPTPTPAVVPTAPTTPDPVAAAPTNADGERITLSREEYNALRAGSEARTAAEGRAESARLALEEANHRLTELSAPSKANPQTPSAQTPAATQQSTALAVDTSGITFSAEEEEAFAESRPYIEKVVRFVLGQELNKYLPEIESRLDAVRQAADGAVSRVAQTNQRTFLQQVTAKVDNLNEVINHKHWGDFIDAIEPFSGLPYGALLAQNVQAEKLAQVVNIYDAFKKQYMDAPANASANANAGYAGANPTGNATQAPPEQVPQQKLKFSDRKKASIDYRHGRITFEELQQVNQKFDAADKLGNVDYNA